MAHPREEQTLDLIELTIRGRLERLGFSRVGDFLSRVGTSIDSFVDEIQTARSELRSLLGLARAGEDSGRLRFVNDRLTAVAGDLFLTTGSVTMVQELCTAVRDAIAERALELSRRELYCAGSHCEAPLALLAVGSAGRREELLFSDQDYLFVHGKGEMISVEMGEAADDYFAHLGSAFSVKMAEAGIPRCSGGIMPANATWRGSIEQWEQRLAQLLRFERNDWEQSIVMLVALMDLRFVCGDRDLGTRLGETVRSMVHDEPRALGQMARVTGSMRLSRGFLRRFIVEAAGPHRGEFNLKTMAWMPLVMGVRLLAAHAGMGETFTPGRIDGLRGRTLTELMARDLMDAYHLLTGLRLAQQNKVRKRIIDDPCYLNPHELAGEERERLRAAIGTVDELLAMIRSMFSQAASADRIIDRSR